MKIENIARDNDFIEYKFENWLKENGYPVKFAFFGNELEDSLVDKAVAAYKAMFEEAKRKAEEEAAAAQQEEEKKKSVMSQILITSGFNFDGYTIKKYSGYISGDDVIQVDRGRQGIFSGTTDVGSALSSALVNLRRNALAELKEAAYDLGCNAVIGVDFDYMTLAPETVNMNGGTLYLPYVFCVTANGNAVIIEKD